MSEEQSIFDGVTTENLIELVLNLPNQAQIGFGVGLSLLFIGALLVNYSSVTRRGISAWVLINPFFKGYKYNLKEWLSFAVLFIASLPFLYWGVIGLNI